MSIAAKTVVLLAITIIAGGMQAIEPPVGTGTRAQAKPDPSRLDGAQLFATHCAMCHQPAALARRLQMAPDPQGAKANITSFLAHHGRTEAAADAAIIDYLTTAAGAP
jgi:mono/diheme cytochrome c family protein